MIYVGDNYWIQEKTKNQMLVSLEKMEPLDPKKKNHPPLLYKAAMTFMVHEMTEYEILNYWRKENETPMAKRTTAACFGKQNWSSLVYFGVRTI